MNEESQRGAEAPAGSYRTPALVFLGALAVRALYLLEISRSPAFDVPIIDSSTYVEIARSMLQTGSIDPRLFWQGFFYPVYLFAALKISGGSLLVPRIIQAVAGSLTAVMVFYAGRRLFDSRTGIVAAVITIIYGPLVFFEGELLAAGWAAFFAITLILLLLKLEEGGGWTYLIAGLIAGSAVVTRATFLPFAAASTAWVLYLSARRDAAGRRRLLHGLLMVSGLAAVMLTVSVLCYRTTGHFSPVPKAGTLNLYIGNNPDTDRTLMIRPGAGWRELINEPRMRGLETDSEHRRYFMERFREYAVTDPAGFLKGLGSKAIQLLSPRELPRNIDIYTYRRYSRFLTFSTWKAGGFGFPFGILLPLALLGLLRAGRRAGWPVLLFLAVYPLSLILVFISARYRVPLIPAMAIAAAAGVRSISSSAAMKRWKELSLTAAAIAVFTAIVSLPGPFVTEVFDYRAELHACVGFEMGKNGDVVEAERHIRTALELDPGNAQAGRMLGNILSQQGRFDEAVVAFDRALEREPDSYTLNFYKSVALARMGRKDDALKCLEEAESGALRARDGQLMVQIRGLRASIQD